MVSIVIIGIAINRAVVVIIVIIIIHRHCCRRHHYHSSSLLSSSSIISISFVIDNPTSTALIMNDVSTTGVEFKYPDTDPASVVARKTSTSTTEDHGASGFTEKKILKNVFIICLAFCFLFTAFQSMSNLQTSLNREKGIGSISLSLIYASLIISCLLLPKFVIARLGCKWTIPIAMIGYIFYMGANFYAVKGTMFAAAIIIGFGAAPLWSAKCTYLTQVGVWYAKLTNQDKDGVINRFFGFFFLFFQSAQIWGNMISSLVFSPPKDNTTLDGSCGAQFCGSNSSNFNQDKDKVYTVCGIYLACAVMAMIIVAVFLDPIKLDKDNSNEDRTLNPKLLLATFKHIIKNPVQVMLIPITIYSGIEQAFITGDYTKAYISCSLGIWNLGYVMICYGVVDAICSYCFGHLVKYVGHIPFFCLAFIVHGGLQVGLLLWEPSNDQKILFYVFAGLWGMGDAVIQTQLNALYGDAFVENTEAGFANYRLWESLGFTVAFAYNEALCTDVKLYICLVVLAFGMVGYTCAEISLRMKTHRSVDISGNKAVCNDDKVY